VEEPLVSAVPIEGNRISISRVEGLPTPVPFDRVRVTLTGVDWQVIGTVEAQFMNGNAILTLPETIAPENLCKVGRDNMNDYEGYWPAEGVSDRDARVAGFEGNNIIACKGDTPVGRLFLTDWDGVVGDTADPDVPRQRRYVYYLYSDRPVELSGHNLSREGARKSFIYQASFATGWNAYTNVAYLAESDGNPPPSLCTTTIPEDVFLRWRFEKW
jgi:hypothetical protein